MKSDKSILREHTLTLINALTNLSPSRNLISQFIFLLPRNSPIIERSYPELVADSTREFLESCFGIKFDEEVQREENGFAEALYKQIHRLFDWLDKEEIRVEIAKLIDVPTNSIPNPYAEWAKAVLSKLLRHPLGNKIAKFLKMLLRHKNFDETKWSLFLDEARRELNANSAEFKNIQSLLTSGNELIDQYGYGTYFTYTYLKPGEYRLDLIEVREHVSHEGLLYLRTSKHHTYHLRHVDTIKKLLEEMRI